MTLSITRLSIKSLYVTISTSDTQHDNAVPLCWVSLFISCYAKSHLVDCCYADCCYAECRDAKCYGANGVTLAFTTNIRIGWSCIQGVREGSTRVGFSLAVKCLTLVEVTVCGKHSSLLRNGINSRKGVLCERAPRLWLIVSVSDRLTNYNCKNFYSVYHLLHVSSFQIKRCGLYNKHVMIVNYNCKNFLQCDLYFKQDYDNNWWL